MLERTGAMEFAVQPATVYPVWVFRARYEHADLVLASRDAIRRSLELIADIDTRLTASPVLIAPIASGWH